MKQLLIPVLLIISSCVFAQQQYDVSINLKDVNEDKVFVELSVPNVSNDLIEYHMPKVVPGTYSISDFGRFVSDFKALDSLGNLLEIKKISTNRWQISNAKKLAKISYWIDDSFDNFSGYGKNKLFEPGGMSIDEENKVFILNTFGFVGYLEDYKFLSYNLTILHDTNLYGATSLKRTASKADSDTFSASNYNFLADAPIMYAEPDTVTKKIAGAEVLVSVFSPNKVLSAIDVMNNIDELMEAQAKYLGGTLPVDRYAYLIYLFDEPTLSGSYGALEHSYSSLYTLPERDPESISQIVKDVAAHEFFHIVTPLNIHSEEIHDFNYIEPKMSQHLWLYEGVTEYASQHVQVKYDLFSKEDFLSEMQQKIIQMERYNVDIPYTTFSQNILQPKNEKKYSDVYAGGAVMAMCLDLVILNSTQGNNDLQGLLRDLSDKYGPTKAFKDAELFDEIEKLTNEEVGQFLRKYIGGTDEIPFTEILALGGVDYQKESSTKVITAGKFGPGLNEDQQLFIRDVSGMNAFGKSLGLKEGDILLEWNGTPLTVQNYSETFQQYYDSTEEGDKVTALVQREKKGKLKNVKLKAKAKLVTSKQKHQMKLMEDLTPEQQEIQAAWLGNN